MERYPCYVKQKHKVLCNMYRIIFVGEKIKDLYMNIHSLITHFVYLGFTYT